jgi:hypothetical protein
MRRSTVRMERGESGVTASTLKLEIFIRDLSDLCRKHGIGITGDAILFVMESIDYQLSYQVDEGSSLSLR